MRYLIAPAIFAMLAWAAYPAAGQSITGCWHYAMQDIYSTVCFDGDGGGRFNMDWAAEDPERGWIKGSCNGRLSVESKTGGRISFSVPHQEGACFAGDEQIRMAQRDYTCAREGEALSCSLKVYYDDGTVWRAASGVEYRR